MGLGIFLAWQRNGATGFLLPSGVRVEFIGTSVGRAAFTTEKSWERLARKHLPRAMTRWIAPATSGSCYRSSNSITVFIRVHDPSGARSQPWTGHVAEDDTGFRYNPGGGTCGFGGGPNTEIAGLIVDAFPRRQESFWLHFLDSNNEVVGSLRVPNPIKGAFPNWQPESLPQSRTNGPVTLTLEGLWSSGGKNWRTANPKWRLSAQDPAWSNAKARKVRLFDATGNEGQWLSPAEPAWKVRALVYRNRDQDFAPAERFSLTNVVVPSAGEFTAIDRTIEFSGVRIVAHVLAGPGKFTITNNAGRGMSPAATASHGSFSHGSVSANYWGSLEPFLLFESFNLEPDDELRIRITDESGREIKAVDGSSGGTIGGGRMMQRKLPPGVDPRSINVEVALNRPLRFEFMVDPGEVR
jgi:hypothetical protein